MIKIGQIVKFKKSNDTFEYGSVVEFNQDKNSVLIQWVEAEKIRLKVKVLFI